MAAAETILDLAPEQQLEQKALTHRDRADALVITDQVSYDSATELLKGLAQLADSIEAYWKPKKVDAKKAHQNLCDAEREQLQPVEQAREIVRSKVNAFEIEQERIEQERQREARAEAERQRREQEAETERARQAAQLAEQQRQEELRLRNALNAEAEGASKVEVDQILEQPALDAAPVYLPPTPLPVPEPVIAPAFQRAAGLSRPEKWKFQVTDFAALVKHVAATPDDLNLLEVNEKALQSLVNSRKQLTKIPGVNVYPDRNISVRRK